MIEVVGINFLGSNKIYYFLPNNINCVKNSNVVVDTERGKQLGVVATDKILIDPQKLVAPLKNVLRLATAKDEKNYNENLKLSDKALKDANKLVSELNLDMKILNASFTLDKKQLLFNFLADDRIDFRELAKKLASIYKTRIELRQIGVRDKAREVGGYGQCGRKLCCSLFLKDMNSVSINMAKKQNIALNPQKINGVCGRLMCCLEYENDCYDEYKKGLPIVGDKVSTEYGDGKVIFVDLFARCYKVDINGEKVVDINM